MTEEYIEYIASTCNGLIIILTLFIGMCFIALLGGIVSGIDPYNTYGITVEKWVPKYVSILLVIIFILCVLWILIPYTGSADDYSEIRGFIKIWLQD